jgi:hypothetical protein
LYVAGSNPSRVINLLGGCTSASGVVARWLSSRRPGSPSTAVHNDGVWAKTRFIFGSLFYGFVGSELAFLTSPLRGLSQKVAALILCTFKCSTPAVPMRTSKPPHIWHAESSNNHGRSNKEDGSANIFILKRGGASKTRRRVCGERAADRPHNRCQNHLRLWLLAFALDLPSLGSSFLLLSLRLAAVGPI